MLQEVPPTFALRSYAKGVKKPRSEGITEVCHEPSPCVVLIPVQAHQRVSPVQRCVMSNNRCAAWLQVRGPYPDTYGKRAIWVGVVLPLLC